MVEPRQLRAIPSDGDTPRELPLALTVRDPEVIRELLLRPEGRERNEAALAALRIGVLALQQAQGRVDADTLRQEGDQILAKLGEQLRAHQEGVQTQLTHRLQEYFDPKSGRFTERVDRLVRKDGELEVLLRRQVGVDDSELAKTLAANLGTQSPLMEILSPEASDGVVAALGGAIESELQVQRERILREFSLDNRDGALSRLVKELSERHGQVGKDLQGSIEKVVGEFSLDDEGSALSRLVQRVERAQEQINREFSLDEKESALARMRHELLEVFEGQKKANAIFQEEVKAALSAMTARKDAVAASTKHGDDFEAALFHHVQALSQRSGDIAAHVGTTPGFIKFSKVGDIVIEMGPDTQAAGSKIVIEAKDAVGYDLAKARVEVETARKNRGALVGLFVFARGTAPQGLAPFARYGNDIVVTWDPEDERADTWLEAGISVARALCTRMGAAAVAHEADFEEVEKAVRTIEKQLSGIDEVKTTAETVERGAQKILKRAKLMREELVRQVGKLDTLVDGLKSAFETDD